MSNTMTRTLENFGNIHQDVVPKNLPNNISRKEVLSCSMEDVKSLHCVVQRDVLKNINSLMPKTLEVLDNGDIRWKETSKIYATIDTPTFRRIHSYNDWWGTVLFIDKNGLYMADNHWFSRLEWSNGNYFFPIKGNKNVISSNWNLYEKHNALIRRLDLVWNIFTEKSRILLTTNDNHEGFNLSVVSFDWNSVYIRDDEWKLTKSQFKMSDIIKVKKISWSFPENGGYWDEPFLVVRLKDALEYIFNLSDWTLYGRLYGIEGFLQMKADRMGSVMDETQKELLRRFIWNNDPVIERENWEYLTKADIRARDKIMSRSYQTR